jgi:hypothetical protein
MNNKSDILSIAIEMDCPNCATCTQKATDTCCNKECIIEVSHDKRGSNYLAIVKNDVNGRYVEDIAKLKLPTDSPFEIFSMVKQFNNTADCGCS